MIHRPGLVAALATALALTSVSAGAQTAGEAEDSVVAIVDGVEIRLSDVRDVQQTLPDQYRSMAPALLFPALRERLVDFVLMSIEGRKANLQDDEVVKRRLAQFEDQLIREVYIARRIDEEVTEDVLRQRYATFVETVPPKEEVKVRHILVETEDEAKAVIERIAGGAAFADVAKETSTGPSADQGGDLGFIARDQVVAEFAEAAFGLAPGEMTEVPVKTGFGWHAIMVEERRVVPPPSFEAMRQQLASEMARQVISDLLSSLREQATIEYIDDPASPEPAPEPASAPEPGAPAGSGAAGQ